MSGTTRSPRVVIVTAGVGGGHDGPATELARRLVAQGARAEVLDLIALGPWGVGALFRWVFRMQLTWAPRSWGHLFAVLDRPGRALPLVARLLVASVSKRMSAVLSGVGADPAAVVVSTFPLGGHVLAAVRRRGGPATPTVTYITDPAVHRLWLVEGTDRYLVTWSQSAQTMADMLGANSTASVLAVAPAVRPAFRRPSRVSACHIRQKMGLPDGQLALVCSGAWGVGAVRRTARELATETGLTPVVVCGRNARLRRQVERIPGVVALGWVDDMAALMRVCEVAVLNSGGLTLAEAAVSGLAVVHHRPLPGQGVANAEFCVRSGWGPRSDNAAELARTVAAVRADGHRLPPAADPTAAILELGARASRLPRAS